MVKNVIKKYLRSLLIEVLNEKKSDENKNRCAQILIGEGSKVRESARIINRQNVKERIRIMNNTIVDGELMVMGYGGQISIGSNCYIGENSRIWSGSEITIGDNVLVSHNVNIIDTNSHQIDHMGRSEDFQSLVKNGPSSKNTGIHCEPIRVEDYAWINFNSTILKGVRVGKGAIIGPNSVVLNDVPEFCFYAGNPAKFIKKIN